MEYIYIGSNPYGEPCAQVGSDYYRQVGKKECKLYIRLIIETLGEPPTGSRLYIKINQHDFGTYYSVNCEYIDKPGADYALRCEGAGIEHWPSEYKEELTQFKIAIGAVKMHPSVMKMTVGDLLTFKEGR